jgi:hypothetical protein
MSTTKGKFSLFVQVMKPLKLMSLLKAQREGLGKQSRHLSRSDRGEIEKINL